MHDDAEPHIDENNDEDRDNSDGDNNHVDGDYQEWSRMNMYTKIIGN